MKVYTIGFTQKTAERFFDLLRSAGVKRVVDVRLNNTGQLAGFSKRDDLIFFLGELCGIEYVHVPELAPTKDILEALIAGRTSVVFVPEPGFIKLFNGRDLTGWAGRSEHWSVKDRAITGITTRENPARGNNFLIARDGGENRIVDDFELRFSYRIIANNDSGFANSGMQYRSAARDNYVVAGYQADFEAGSTFSGILYDEGGGAGGRGIMAQRGQSVVWTADGDREVTGPIPTSPGVTGISFYAPSIGLSGPDRDSGGNPEKVLGERAERTWCNSFSGTTGRSPSWTSFELSASRRRRGGR